MGDGHTPRLWYMSEVNHGYAKKGDAAPSIGGQHPNCFTDKRTPVLTEHGWKRINDIDINERVLTHKGVFKAVKGKVLFPYRRKPMFHVKYKFQNTVQTLRVTPDHQFLTPGGWKEARDLSVGDSLSRLVVPCAVCGAEASMESGSTGAFKMQHTCASKECVATLRKEDAISYHSSLTDEERMVRSANCSAGTSLYRAEHPEFKSALEKKEWTPEQRQEQREALISRLPRMLKASASTRISREQKLAFGWLRSAFPKEDIKMEFGVGHYAIDIAFSRKKIAVEINGKYHESADRQSKDKKRDEELSKMGWTVLRFGVSAPATVSKENVVGGVSTILNNHNGNYKFEWAEIVAVKEVRSSDTKNAMAYCLQVEDDESFVSKGVVSHNCRHSICHMPPGYGFDAAGNIEYKHVGYDAIKVQRG